LRKFFVSIRGSGNAQGNDGIAVHGNRRDITLLFPVPSQPLVPVYGAILEVQATQEAPKSKKKSDPAHDSKRSAKHETKGGFTVTRAYLAAVNAAQLQFRTLPSSPRSQ